MTTPALSEAYMKILELLGEYAGMATDTILERLPVGYFQETNKTYRRTALLCRMSNLIDAGFVTLIPKPKPGCWVRTPAGTEALNAGRDEA